MVYETRVGDVFTLGTTSWRVEQITHDQVLVSPPRAPQDDCRFGRAMHQVGRWSWGARSARSSVRWCAASGRCRARLREAGLDEFAANNLVSYLAEQQAATGALPTDQTVVFERFRDELGDWRVCVHCPLGTGVLSLGASRRALGAGALRHGRAGDRDQRRHGAPHP